MKQIKRVSKIVVFLCMVIFFHGSMYAQEPTQNVVASGVRTIVNGTMAKDSYGESGFATTPPGNQSNLYVGLDGLYSKGYTRIYIAPSLPVLPANATITSSYLEMYQYVDQAKTNYGVTLYPIIQDWEERDLNNNPLTWNNQPGKGNAIGNFTVASGVGWKSFDITSLTKQWYAGTSANYGVTIWATNEAAKGGIFYSMDCYSQCSNGAYRPRLVVDYVLPTPTPTYTSSPTNTPTRTPLPPTKTLTPVPTITSTPKPTNTPVTPPSPTNTATATPTDTPTNTPTSTSTSTPTNTPTATNTALRPTSTPTNTPIPTPVPLNKRIGIEAGHGNGDPGSLSCDKQHNEADNTIVVANLAAQTLRAKGYTVDVFRTHDAAIKGYQGAVFISLHNDWCAAGVKGFKVSRYGGQQGSGLNGSNDPSDMLVKAVWAEYQKATSLIKDTSTGHFTNDMLYYYALNSSVNGISTQTPGAILEMAWWSGDVDMLLNHRDVLATGVVNSLLAFLGNANSTQRDTIPPSGNITSPNNGITISPGSLTLKADAWDNVGGSGIKQVEFWVYYNAMWQRVQTVYKVPYEFNWQIPTSLKASALQIGIHVVDNAGNVAIDPGGKRLGQYTGKVKDTTPPTGNIVVPVNNSYVLPGSLYIKANASDNNGGSGVDKVLFWVRYGSNWHLVGTDYSSPYEAVWRIPSVLAPQDLEIGIHVHDKAGNQVVDPGGKRTVKYVWTIPDTTKPSGNITSPANNSTAKPGTTLALRADAWDNAGGSGVKQVEIYVYYDGTWRLAAKNYTAPYGTNWIIPSGLKTQNIEIGLHVVDNAGNVAIDPGGKRVVKVVNLTDTPYIHQLWSTEDTFNGNGACGPSSLGMLLAWYGKLAPTDLWGSSNHPEFKSPFSWYVTHAFNGFSTSKAQDASCRGQYAGLYGAVTISSCGGSGREPIDAAITKMGLKTNWNWTNINSLKQTVNQGKLAIIGTNLCSLGHIVLVRGYDNNTGEFIVSDPYGQCNGNNSWNYNTSADARSVRYTWDRLKATWQIELQSSYQARATNMSFDVLDTISQPSQNQPTEVDGGYRNLFFLPPVTSLIANDGQGYTNQPQATMKFDLRDISSPFTQIRFGEDGISWGEWLPFAYETNIDLSANDGLKTIFAETKDTNNQTQIVSTTIVLDTVPPTGTIEIAKTPDSDNDWMSYHITTEEDPRAGGKMIISQDPLFTDAKWGDFIGADLIARKADGNTIYAKLMDAAGNVSEVINQTITAADFAVTPRCGDTFSAFNFMDNSLGDVTTWQWDFGDGNISPEQNPMHVYTQTGSYTVSLAISGTATNQIITRANHIRVTDDNLCNTASITITNKGTDTTFSGDLGDFTLANETQQTFQNLSVDNYTIAQALPEQWYMFDTTCEDQNGNFVPVEQDRERFTAKIPVELGQNLTCTFINQKEEKPIEPTINSVYLPIITQ